MKEERQTDRKVAWWFSKSSFAPNLETLKSLYTIFCYSIVLQVQDDNDDCYVFFNLSFEACL